MKLPWALAGLVLFLVVLSPEYAILICVVTVAIAVVMGVFFGSKTNF